MQNKVLQEDSSFFKKIWFYFNKLTSNHGKDWQLALVWIIIFEVISSIYEYEYLEIAQNYIYHVPEGFLKEIVIAILVVFFIWYSVYSLIFMKRNRFFYLALFGSIGAYLVVTHDVTFNLLIHNIINPFEFEFNSFGIYIILQLFLKLIIAYLIFMLFISIKNKKSKN